MRRYPAHLLHVFFALIVLALIGCDGSQPAGVPSDPDDPDVGANIVVFVHWQDEGVPGHDVELLETGEIVVTDEDGHAVFAVAPGAYTVRIFGLNLGGPALRFVDYPVGVANVDVHVEAIDCLLCY